MMNTAGLSGSGQFTSDELNELREMFNGHGWKTMQKWFRSLLEEYGQEALRDIDMGCQKKLHGKAELLDLLLSDLIKACSESLDMLSKPR